MKFVATLALAGLAGLCLVGTAEALPLAPAALVAAPQTPVVEAAMVVTKTVRRGRFGRRVVTKRVVRRGPMGRSVTTTRTVR